ncbi:hypothetical protein ACE6H2_015736 [Prunus campanulata]
MYELLHIALKYKAPLHRYVQKVNESLFCNLQVPSEEDWTIAQLVSGFLQIFYSSTKIFSGVYYPTSSHVINCLIDIHGSFAAYSEFSVFKDALTEMKTKFDKYWKEFPMVFCFATIMDPRFKLFAIAEWLDMIGIDQLTKKRASLSPSTIEALICLKDWALAYSRKQDASVDEQRVEELMNIRASRPDWMVDNDVEIVGESENETIQS